MMNRRQTRQVMIGNVLVGGDAPIAVQSMCSTDTRDVDTTIPRFSIPAATGDVRGLPAVRALLANTSGAR